MWVTIFTQYLGMTFFVIKKWDLKIWAMQFKSKGTTFWAKELFT